jgi:hypothetical protein
MNSQVLQRNFAKYFVFTINSNPLTLPHYLFPCFSSLNSYYLRHKNTHMKSHKFPITNSIPAHPKMQPKILIRIKAKIRPKNPSESLANVCAPPHREHPSKLSAIQPIKCRSRCSHPQLKIHEIMPSNFLKFHASNFIPARPKIQPKILIRIKARIRPKNPSENLANVCAPPHRKHPSELSTIQPVTPRSKCSHPQLKILGFRLQISTDFPPSNWPKSNQKIAMKDEVCRRQLHSSHLPVNGGLKVLVSYSP